MELKSIRKLQQCQHLHLKILTNTAHLRFGQRWRQINYTACHTVTLTTDYIPKSIILHHINWVS